MKLYWRSMMMAGVITASGAALPAFADVTSNDVDFKLGVRGGTLGYGAEVGFQPHKRLVIRASMTQAEVNLEETFSGIDYDLTADLGAAGVQVDLYPLFGGIYITGGVFANDNEISLTATPSEGLTIGDTSYTPAEVGTLLGTVEFEDIATFVGVGWTIKVPALPIESFIEAGGYFQGAGQVSYVATGLLASDPNFLEDLDAEALELEDDLSAFEIYPSVNIGLRLTF